MRLTGNAFDALMTDLDAALAELVAAAGADPARWERGRPGGWTVGQHVAHVDITLRRTAEAFEEAEGRLRAGELAPAPARRGWLEGLWVGLVAGRGLMPRGLKTTGWATPNGQPERASVLAALRRDADRHRAIGARLSPGERDRLWIENPFRGRWHYRLAEMVRVHAVHARHHARMVAEIPGGR